MVGSWVEGSVLDFGALGFCFCLGGEGWVLFVGIRVVWECGDFDSGYFGAIGGRFLDGGGCGFGGGGGCFVIFEGIYKVVFFVVVVLGLIFLVISGEVLEVVVILIYGVLVVAWFYDVFFKCVKVYEWFWIVGTIIVLGIFLVLFWVIECYFLYVIYFVLVMVVTCLF